MKNRAMEQGADGMLPLVVLKDRFSARVYEGAISRALGLPQVVRSHVKLGNMSMRKDLEEVGEDLFQLKEDLIMLWDDAEKKVHSQARLKTGPSDMKEKPILVDDYPLNEPLDSKPKRFKGERVIGKVLGFKGNYMIFREGGIHSFRFIEAVGRVLHTNEDLGKYV
jgi:hypothetical protein